MNRNLRAAMMVVALSPMSISSALARDKAPADVVFVDGAIGSVTAECGLGDLCASLVLPNKDVIELYNLGAGSCQAYTLSLARKRGDTVLFQSPLQSASKRVKEGPLQSDCDLFVSTYYTFDAGKAKLGLFLSHDGTLFGEWSVQSSDTGSK